MSGNYTLRWYGKPIGTFDTGPGLSIESFEFISPFGSEIFPSSENDVPVFLENLKPQGMMSEIFNGNSAYRFRESVSRFLSNVTITNGNYDPKTDKHIDSHSQRLTATIDAPYADYIYYGETPCSEGKVVDKIARYWAKAGMPRFSGYETKIPVKLESDGLHVASKGNSFTHFLKMPPAETYRQALCFNEWFCLQLAEAAGLETANNALIFLNQDEGGYPSLLSERYDLSDDSNSSEWFLTQDGCTISGEGFEQAGNGSYEKLFKAIKEYSTDIEQDREDFFRRVVLTLAVQDTDFHKKNISMLFEYNSDYDRITSRRIAPTYDVTSDISSPDNSRRLQLSVAGKKSGINRKAIIRFGESLGLETDRAAEILDESMNGIIACATHLCDKSDLFPNDDCEHVGRRITTLVMQSAAKLGIKTPHWVDEPINKDNLPSVRIGEDTRGGLTYMQ